MSQNGKTTIAEILARHEPEILNDWIKDQTGVGNQSAGRIKEAELRGQCKEFLNLLQRATAHGNFEDIQSPTWSGVRDLLANLSRSRGVQGFSPSETATFVFSLKRPLFTQLRQEFAKDADGLAEATWASTQLLDKLGLFSAEVFMKTREDLISRQQEEMLELSTPVVKLWDGILALPMIGTLDSSRTQIVMESLLQKIVETGSGVAIIDITGVPTVDTLTAQHLLKTVTAARLMGAECIISGIRPQIAQTIVHLGVELGGVITKATLADAFAIALEKTGRMVGRSASRS
jgi:rsbT co-antagonist protein RsbR